MRKKTILISFAIITLVAFGTVSSAYAFADPISISIVLGAGFISLVTAAEEVKDTKAAMALQQAKEQQAKQQEENSAPTTGLATRITVQPAR